jgi:predicted polyphosphate/ATP-dependent NAD kinase
MKQSTRVAVTVPVLALPVPTVMATPVFATTLTVAAASGMQSQHPYKHLYIELIIWQ